MDKYIGIDIGGTKCAVVAGDENGNVLDRFAIPTGDCEETLAQLFDAVEKHQGYKAIGVSCGGPLNAVTGTILSPPNLPGWDNVEITKRLTERFKVPAFLRNDADACAVAEWKYGAGRGTRNMVFLTCGTGMGAGLILDGKLYSGTNGSAGEVGHIRLTDAGPVGYGKIGSFEGYCSGGGIAQLGETVARVYAQQGKPVSWADGTPVTAKRLAEAANAGDKAALEVWKLSGQMLGRGISLLIDLLNPERIVIGSIFQRSENLLRGEMEDVIVRECLAQTAGVCEIVPAQLGDSIGDIAALSIAVSGIKGEL